jgi:hypothetical protein
VAVAEDRDEGDDQKLGNVRKRVEGTLGSEEATWTTPLRTRGRAQPRRTNQQAPAEVNGAAMVRAARPQEATACHDGGASGQDEVEPAGGGGGVALRDGDGGGREEEQDARIEGVSRIATTGSEQGWFSGAARLVRVR